MMTDVTQSVSPASSHWREDAARQAISIIQQAIDGLAMCSLVVAA